ncbi:hypothetical protein FJY90_02745 [Candidatus Gottesmanbacteria bacterium]|nr:hypothetical protein [Candidatus Gottesmanbacteria bacterium]
MTIAVSITEFRQKISDYLAQARAGHTILLKDKKKGETVAEVIGKKKFDPKTFGIALKDAMGTFTAENHQEWKTKRHVIKWVEKTRKEADRTL